MTRRRARIAFAIAAPIAFLTLIGLGFGMTFFADEWAFIESRSLGDPATWLPPHNEHWTTLPLLLYRAIVETIGIGSYVPFLAVVAVLHVLVATLVYALLERSSGPLLALLGGVIVLFFGSGFENLFWGFQSTFVGSLALGLAAMAVTDRDPTRGRVALVAALLMASIMCSTIGVIVAIAVGVQWVIDPRWRAGLTALLLPAIVLAAWLLTVGRPGVTARDPLTWESASAVPGYVASGIANAAGAVSGLPALGLLIAAVALPLTVRRLRQGVVPARAIGILVAVAVQYLLIGLVRGRLGPEFGDYSRYTYVSGILVLVALGDLLGPIALPRNGRARTASLAILTTWATLALIHNGWLLLAGRDLFLARADLTRALVAVALDPARSPAAGRDRSLVLVPAPASLERIVAAHGDPRSDHLVPWAVRAIPPAVTEEAERRVRGSS